MLSIPTKTAPLEDTLPEESKKVVQQNCAICMVPINDEEYRFTNRPQCENQHFFHRYCLDKVNLFQKKYTDYLSCYVCRVSFGEPKEAVEEYDALPIVLPNSRHWHLKGASQFQQYQSTPNLDLMNDCLINLSLAVDLGCTADVALLAKMEFSAAKYYLKRVTDNVENFERVSMKLLETMLKSSSEHGNEDVETLFAESFFIIGMRYFLHSKRQPVEEKRWIKSAIEYFKNSEQHGHPEASLSIGECELALGGMSLADGKNRSDADELAGAIEHFYTAIERGNREARVRITEAEFAFGKLHLIKGESKSDTLYIDIALNHFDKANKHGHEEVKEFIFKAQIAIGRIYLEKGKNRSDRFWINKAIEYFEKAIKYGIEENVESLPEADSLIAEANNFRI